MGQLCIVCQRSFDRGGNILAVLWVITRSSPGKRWIKDEYGRHPRQWGKNQDLGVSKDDIFVEPGVVWCNWREYPCFRRGISLALDHKRLLLIYWL